MMKSEKVRSKNPERFRIQDFLAPPVGLEPTTLRLTAACSTDWAKEEYVSYLEKGSSCVGIDLFSRAVASQVSSALLSLTSVFGMGTGDPQRHKHRLSEIVPWKLNNK